MTSSAGPARMSFADLGVSPALVDALAQQEIVEPTPIQTAAIPPLLEGRDLLGQAQTGTGKTAAFVLPILERIQGNGVQALVVAPTRELALQVSRACKRLGKAVRVRVVAVYGGTPYGPQLRALDNGAQVVVGTPGRLLDLLSRGALDLSGLRIAVLDEADEMLQMGFIDDIETLLGAAPESKQVALFSATVPRAVRGIADRHLKNPIDASIKGDKLAVAKIIQQKVTVRQHDKFSVLQRLLEVETPELALIFARTRLGCAELAEQLDEVGLRAVPLHGDMSQAHRELMLRRFRSGQAPILVGTDVAARGLDVEGITHVFNYDLPDDADIYVHRIGRTGRAGREGKAISLVKPQEGRRINFIERHMKQRLIERPWPTRQELIEGRATALRNRVGAATGEEGLEPYLDQVALLTEAGLDVNRLAAAALKLLSAERPLEVQQQELPDEEVLYFLAAGRRHRVRPQDIVGLLINEFGLPKDGIGSIRIQDGFTTVFIGRDHVRKLGDTRTVMLRGRPTSFRPDSEREERPASFRPRDRPPFRKGGYKKSGGPYKGKGGKGGYKGKGGGGGGGGGGGFKPRRRP